jgi:hypothetical protein
MNDTYYAPGTRYDTPVWRAAVVCQEVGHTFRLDHQDESGGDFHISVDHADYPAADNTHPNTHDYEELAAIYSHLDTSRAIGLSADDGAKPYKTKRRDNRRSTEIVEFYADGSEQLTFIFWA